MNKLREWLTEALSSANNFENIEMKISAGNGKWTIWMEEEDPEWSCGLVVQMKKWLVDTPNVEQAQTWILQQAPWYSHAILGWINENYQSRHPLADVLMETYLTTFEPMLSTAPGFTIPWFEYNLTQHKEPKHLNAWKRILARLSIERLSTELMYASCETLPYLRDEWLVREKNPSWVKETAYWLITREHDRDDQIEFILQKLKPNEFLYGVMLLKMIYPEKHNILDQMTSILNNNVTTLVFIWKHQILELPKVNELDVPT